MGESPPPHVPVMADAVLRWLRPGPGAVIIDATLGAGGHAAACLQRGARVIGIDCDGEALTVARQRLTAWPDSISFHRANFSALGEVMAAEGRGRVSAVLLDLGLSSMQLENRGRGFSFQGEGELDMRMDDRLPTTAHDLIATLPEGRLADILWNFGEERGSRRLAAAIVAARRRRPIATTRDLVEVIEAVVPRRGKIHPATRTFQALRIAINGELQNLASTLPQGFEALETGGRMVVLSYHSLEDRIVKNFFRQMKGAGRGEILTPKPERPAAAEVHRNPRSRSARLRAIERVT